MAAGDANGKTLHARRLVLAELPDTDVVRKLFETLAPGSRIGRVATRGFCVSATGAAIRQRSRTSSWSAASTAPATKVDKEEGEGEAPKKAKGVGERIRRAAQRIRGGKGEGGSKAQAGGQTRGKAQKSTTPRKAGGS